MSRAAIPVATQAFSSRAPSIWVASPFALRDLHDLVEIGLLPDRAAADIGGLLDADHGLRRLIARARVKRLAKGIGRKLPIGAGQRVIWNPPSAACAPPSRAMIWAVSWARISSPGRQCTSVAATLHMVPEGMNTAASLPSNPATRSHSSIHGRIVADLFVADFGPCHRLAHRGRRAGLCVRQQIDADRRLPGIARGRGVACGSLSWSAEVSTARSYPNKKAPAKPGP